MPANDVNPSKVGDYTWTNTPVDKSSPSQETPATFELEDHPIDEYRSLRVAIIGAGIAGVTAGALLPVKVPGIQLTIYDKNADIGGTWFENTYPGVRCDIPSTVYQSTFHPNPEWTEEFAQGAEIRDYWQGFGRKYDVYKYAKFNTKVSRAEWDATRSEWKLSTENLKTGEASEEYFDFAITAVGLFNAWRYPDIKGLDTFKGHLCHSSNWDQTYDPADKSIAVIGNGASGIQVVPALQKVVKRLDHYARSRTWIAGSLGGRDRTAEPQYFTEEQLESFKDLDKQLEYRKQLEATYCRNFGNIIAGSEASANSRERFRKLMADRLVKNPELLDKLVPEFSPQCRRLTPGPGYLEALVEPNVDFIQTGIKEITPTGITTTDGVHREVDAIVCSTGAKVDFAPTFPIVAGDVDLAEAWTPSGKFGFPYTYLGLATPGFPNLAFLYGPNSIGGSGTVSQNDETQITYIAQLLRKIATQGIKAATPSKAAADDFVQYCDSFFPGTVLTEQCSSWANGRRPGGRIHGLWPGSAAHVTVVRRAPRWEDWEWTLRSQTGNRFAYFGNGRASKEFDDQADITSYLKRPDRIDLRDHHESWWDM